MARYNQPYILTEANFSLSLFSALRKGKKETNKKVFCVCLYTIYCLLLHEYENQMLDLVYYILNFFLPFPFTIRYENGAKSIVSPTFEKYFYSR